MKVIGTVVRTALLIGLTGTALSTGASAADMITPRQTQFQQACTQFGGRFEEAWRYNDQGVQWGKVISCAADGVSIICEGESCAAVARDDSRQRSTVGAATDANGILTFAAEPTTFAKVLSSRVEE